MQTDKGVKIMPCDGTPFYAAQTLTERKKQVTETVADLARELAAGRVKVKVGPQGAVAFDGWQNRNGITDACALRRIMATGSTQAKLAIMKAEQLSGRSINKQAVAAGHHSHDGGATWHKGH
jgi:hypothetical protein